MPHLGAPMRQMFLVCLWLPVYLWIHKNLLQVATSPIQLPASPASLRSAHSAPSPPHPSLSSPLQSLAAQQLCTSGTATGNRGMRREHACFFCSGSTRIATRERCWGPAVECLSSISHLFSLFYLFIWSQPAVNRQTNSVCWCQLLHFSWQRGCDYWILNASWKLGCCNQ